MAFALFYNGADLAAMAAAFQDARVSGKDRNDGRTFWNNGLSGWQTAPLAPSEHPDADTDPDLRIIVIANNTLASFRQYLYTLADHAKTNGDFAEICIAVADDMAFRQGAVEPWPWVPTAQLPTPWADILD